MSELSLEDELNSSLGCLLEEQSHEIVHGVSYGRQQLDPKHAFARAALGVKLSYVDWRLQSAEPEWLLLDQPEIRLEGHLVFPDLVGWKYERLPSPSEEAIVGITPDWICEILTSSTEQKDRIIKMPLYAELGVKHFWLVNPALQSLEIYQLENQRWTLVSAMKEDAKVNAAPFEAVHFALNNLWSG